MPEPTPDQPGTTNGTGHLLAFLADCPAECPVCDYSLRGLTQPKCPECGAELELRVGSPRLHVGAWALAIISFALALGFDGVVSLIMIIAIATSPNIQWIALGICSLFLLLATSMATGLLVVARSRPRWTRRPTRTQWTHAVAVFLTVGMIHALIGLGWMSLWAW